jgi:hypothetical protein
VGRQIDYEYCREVLEEVFEEALKDSQKDHIVKVPKIVEASAKILFESKTQAFREALLGCALARMADGDIDITKPYMNQGDDAFNGRTLDERVVNPFLQEKEVPCSKGPFLSALRRNISFTPETEKGLRDKEAFGAMLAFIAELQAGNHKTVRAYLLFLLSMFVHLRSKSTIALARINRVSIGQYSTVLDRLLGTPSGGLLPVLLAVAGFSTVKKVYDLPWEIDWQGINVADASSGAGGDLTVTRDSQVIVAVEITERLISADRVRSTFRTKISPNAIDDYLFFFSGPSPSAEAVTRAETYFAQGHEISFVPLKDWLTLVLSTLGAKGRSMFTDEFLALMDKKDVPATVKVAWNDIVRDVFG